MIICKTELFADDMILSTPNFKDCPPKPLDMINKFSEVARYKINIKKFQYTTTNQEEKFKKQSHMQFHQKEYLKINKGGE